MLLMNLTKLICSMTDTIHESFILECVDKSPYKTSLDALELVVCTRLGTISAIEELGDNSQSKNLDYCSELLKSVDAEDSAEDAYMDLEVEVLPYEVVSMISSGNIKRSLIGSMEEAYDKKIKTSMAPYKCGHVPFKGMSPGIMRM